jgi:calcium-binding protein CML
MLDLIPQVDPNRTEVAMADTDRESRVRDDFNKIDKDSDGFITVTELREYHKSDPKATAEEVNIVARYADADGDDRISYEEYAQFVR